MNEIVQEYIRWNAAKARYREGTHEHAFAKRIAERAMKSMPEEYTRWKAAQDRYPEGTPAHALAKRLAEQIIAACLINGK